MKAIIINYLLLPFLVAVWPGCAHSGFFDDLTAAIKSISDDVEKGVKGASSHNALSERWNLNSEGNAFLQSVIDDDVDGVRNYLIRGDEQAMKSNASGVNAIYLAVFNQNARMLAMLLENKKMQAHVNAKISNMDGDATGTVTPLCIAARLDETGDIVKLLVEAGADLDVKCGDYGWSPLQYAMNKNSRSKQIKTYVDNGADIYIKASTGMGNSLSLLAMGNKAGAELSIMTLLDSLVAFGERYSIPLIKNSVHSYIVDSYSVKDKNCNLIVRNGEDVRQTYTYVTDTKWDVCGYGGPSVEFVGYCGSLPPQNASEVARNKSCEWTSRSYDISRLARYDLRRLTKSELEETINAWRQARAIILSKRGKTVRSGVKYSIPKDYQF
jgi:hypothetical protein